MIVVLAAAGGLLATVVMALHAMWQRRVRNRAILHAGRSLSVAALAILDAVIGDGWQPRRSAVAFMVASWALRRTITILYTRVFEQPPDDAAASPWRFQAHALWALCLSLPALVASVNDTPAFSLTELVGAGLWVVGFAAEASERPRLRHISRLTYVGYALFAFASLRWPVWSS